ncbi:MAG: GIY-YIG nuclease family protein [Chitinophagaceae bacterium]|uniref:GIY-YIG nuclease family protein n=1 Tax=Microcystis sp. M061S2 TaxID=2771171 RepID=UPI00258912A8|nr:GIY-YIG nuclease family protein [Microcystis sp. M061S2]MCA2656636.1 GIY-YIG nuclease family protein [Microcystis sp. M061S2]MCA6471457.1 GIY-YIG nuclease family protein [Chitinophagaceae bacterium]
MILSIDSESKKKYFSGQQKGGVIYKITNNINNNFYIGSTNNLIKRYYTHINHMRLGKNTCPKLIRAVSKYGENNFKFEIVCECPTDKIIETEQKYIDNLKPHYNVAKIAGSNLGIKRTDEVKLKKSVSQKQKWKNKTYREEHLKNLSKNWKAGTNHWAAKLTEEQVIEIKKQLANGIIPKQVSDNLNVSYYSVKDICRGKTWKHIEICTFNQSQEKK